MIKQNRQHLLTYLDMNNLYGWAMSSYFSYGGFNWLKNFDGFDVNSISKKSSIGYIFEVDLKYPDELHVLHIDYTLAPEKLAIPCCQIIAKKKKKKMKTNME